MAEATKAKARMTQDFERCKECGYCIDNCPKKALSFSGTYNKKGYDTAIIDHGKCIQCAICFSVCPDYVFEKVED